MTDRRTAVAARVAAIALAVLSVSAGVTTSYVVRHAVAERGAGSAVAAVGTLAVTGALAWGAVRLWLR